MKEITRTRYVIKSGDFYLSNVRHGRMLLVTGIENAYLYFDKDSAKTAADKRNMKIFKISITERPLD